MADSGAQSSLDKRRLGAGSGDPRGWDRRCRWPKTRSPPDRQNTRPPTPYGDVVVRLPRPAHGNAVLVQHQEPCRVGLGGQWRRAASHATRTPGRARTGPGGRPAAMVGEDCRPSSFEAPVAPQTRIQCWLRRLLGEHQLQPEPRAAASLSRLRDDPHIPSGSRRASHARRARNDTRLLSCIRGCESIGFSQRSQIMADRRCSRRGCHSIHRLRQVGRHGCSRA